MKNIYQEKGYKDRQDYLDSVAEDFRMDQFIVNSVAEVLGEYEDFDGLISLIDDFSVGGYDYE